MNYINEYRLIFSNNKYDKNNIPGLITLNSIIQGLDKIYDRVVISHKENISIIPCLSNGTDWFKKLNWIMCNIGDTFNLSNSKEWLFIYPTGLFFKKWHVCILVNTDKCKNDKSCKGLELFKIQYKNNFNGIIADKDILPNFKIISYINDYWIDVDVSPAYHFIHSFIEKSEGR